LVTRIASESLAKLVHVDREPALVLFSGEWCGDCATFAPLWKSWASGRAEPIYTVEVLRGAPEWNDWEIDEIPTVVAYSDGAEKGRCAGVILEEDLDGLLRHVTKTKVAKKRSR
jgi:thioredoxin-like negative regulator of GroEL